MESAQRSEHFVRYRLIQKSESPKRNFPEDGGLDVVSGYVSVFCILYLAEILVPASDFDDIFSVYTEVS